MWGFAALSPWRAQGWGCPCTQNSDTGAAAGPSWEAGRAASSHPPYLSEVGSHDTR